MSFKLVLQESGVFTLKGEAKQGPAGPPGTGGPGGGALTVRDTDGNPNAVVSTLVFPANTVGIVDDVATITGLQGPAGATGPQGPIGNAGPAGPTGPQGIQGVPGATGPAGAQGIQGETGNTGPQGPQGPIGLTGPAGPQGPTGATGPQGPQGPPGSGEGGGELIVGEVDGNPDAPVTQLLFQAGTVEIIGGTAIITGLQGPQGPAGATGPQGATGAQGATGPQGNTGPAGATGAQGPQGIQGPTGNTGPQGPQGIQGPQGEAGPVGATGPAGQGVPTGGTIGQVLTKASSADFDADWVTPSGSSGSSVKQVVPYFSHATAFLTRQGSAPSTMALIANRLYHIPIPIEATREFTEICVVVTTARAASNVRLGIRNANQSTAEPTTLVTDAGDVDSSTTGPKIAIGFSAPLTPGLYYLDLLASDSVSVTTWNQPVSILGTQMAGTSSPSILQLVRDGVPYGALPSDETGVSQTVSTSGALIVGIR